VTRGRPERRGGAARAWWIKCDPTAPAHGGWNWPDLFDGYEEGVPYTWSVGTALSQRNAREARPGDPVFGYAAGEGHRHLLALAEVVRGSVFVAGEGPAARRGASPGGFTVDLRPVALLGRPLTLGEVRDAMRGLEPEFFRTRFGSIFKVRGPEFRRLRDAVERANPEVRFPRRWSARSAPARHKKG